MAVVAREPGLQWKHAASAMALAETWEAAKGFPPSVVESLATDPDLTGLELSLGLPETGRSDALAAQGSLASRDH